MKHFLPFLALSIVFLSCNSSVSEEDLVPIFKNDSINLYAFVGEKISVDYFDPNEGNLFMKIDSITGDTVYPSVYIMDNGFRNKYRLLKNIYNELEPGTIDFVSYDHYGRPEYEGYSHVILYLSLNAEDGIYYHQKYQFDPVEKTKDGTWKGPNGESLEELFNEKKNGVLTARGIFEE
jgi:hypothetical protein